MRVAIIENNTVTNVIICDSLELAKDVTGVEEVLDASEYEIGMGFKRINGKWVPEQPYPSWILNESVGRWGSWESPVPYPTTDVPHIWDEMTTSWVPHIV